MSQINNRVRKPDIRKTLLASLREGYYNLGFVVFASAMTTLVTFALAWLTSALLKSLPFQPWHLVFYVPAICAGYLVSVGVYDYTYKCVTHQNPVLMDAISAIREYWRVALKLFFTDFLLTIVIISDLVYCWMLAIQKGGLIYTALAVFVFYLLAIWTMVMMYHLPILVDAGKDCSIKDILKRSLILTFGNPAFTLVVFVAIIAFAVICALPVFAGWVALLVGGCAFFCCSAMKELYITYGLIPDDPTEPEDPGLHIQEDKTKNKK